MPSQTGSKTYRASGGVKRSEARMTADNGTSLMPPEEAAEYLEAMLPEMIGIADRAGLELTSYLLRMAHRDMQDKRSEER